jgi:hypothetical protein
MVNPETIDCETPLRPPLTVTGHETVSPVGIVVASDAVKEKSEAMPFVIVDPATGVS